MSDPDRMCLSTNISIPFFKEFKQINDRHGKPLVNVYVSYADRSQPVSGTVYLIHGYGGSPVEPCMKLPMQKALRRGFDVVAIEGVALSATSGGQKNLSEMTLTRQKAALLQGLKYAAANYDLCRDYNIAWAHSMSCRALSDLIVYSEQVRNYFNEFILNNPYFFAASKVEVSKEKFLQRDPTGKMWKALAHKTSVQSRQIENEIFKVPTCLNNLTVPLPETWRSGTATLDDLVKRMSEFINKNSLKIKFVLGTNDDMAEYHKNLRVFEALDSKHKELVPINGGDHSFENVLDIYAQTTSGILDQIRNIRRAKSL